MRRQALQELINWRNNPAKMPLIIEGARQVGKTWLMQEFGKTYYQNTVYINFDENKTIQKLFDSDLNPRRIIEGLELAAAQKIKAGETLIIFDEIQECNRALMALKYFCENAPEYHIVSAGSLLGVAIHKNNSFPVGKVSILPLYPLSFAEFMDALGETRYQTILAEKAYASAHIIENELIKCLKYYYFIGGLPRAVLAYMQNRDLTEARNIQRDILANYERDFSKHLEASAIPKVGLLWNSIPGQLAKENKQFIYRKIKNGARASQYELALYWLEKAGLAYKVPRVETPNLPLSAYQKEAFKLYLLDVGLLSAQAGLTMQNLLESDPDVFNHFKGALTEQFVLQELKAAGSKPQVFYWQNDRKKGTAEVDFLIQNAGEIIPVEAKASTNLKAKSLKVYLDYYQPRAAIRTSLSSYSRHKNLYNIPLYLIGQFADIIHQP
jgi:predicted AAA+ superfamily ATPase